MGAFFLPLLPKSNDIVAVLNVLMFGPCMLYLILGGVLYNIVEKAPEKAVVVCLALSFFS
jgi:hypothetical protein